MKCFFYININNLAMKTIKIFLFILILFVFIGCKYECPGFDKTLITWIPYNIGDELTFSNQNSDTIKFIIVHKAISEEEKVKRSCGSKCCESTANIIAESTYDDNYKKNSLTYDIVFTYMENWIHSNISLGKYNNHNGMAGITDFERHIDSMSINGFLFNEVVVLERDTLKFPDDEIWKVIVANNYGIVKFFDRKTGDEWILQY